MIIIVIYLFFVCEPLGSAPIKAILMNSSLLSSSVAFLYPGGIGLVFFGIEETGDSPVLAQNLSSFTSFSTESRSTLRTTFCLV